MTLSAHDISLSLTPERTTLDTVSIRVRPGEVLALIGQNGAGKSSLLKVLCGEYRPDGGEVRLHDRSLNDWSGPDRARLLSVLPQQHTLNFEFLVEDVVGIGRYPHRTGRRHDDKIVREALDLCDLLSLRQRGISELSGGERQRVHLARVLAQIWEAQPEGHRFLLLDEPSTGLDLHHQQALFRTVRQFAQRGVGVLLVVHDLNLAARYADQIVVLDQGRAVLSGPPKSVLTAEHIERHFDLRVTVQAHPHHDCPLIVSH
ncbi:heme ABC transporter ATP-binding protein [Saccharospirillum salsuginis]|uniref:Hemin import ATP-binding protein HmuV n=1 Tax=Saccharospirillum salsuginis TaxID=418750 RepID=A0A918K3U4_9GAMM|nr:heme ABC transporter ATP-binding protein [Saccharospirillum salsuginis]GGX45887.1 hemin import ATP-binding protein HmuV [Saccharospirillum salsuginis]